MKKRTLNLNVPVFGLDKTDLGTTLGKALGDVLVRSAETINPVKFYDWGVAIYNGDPLELDDQDFDLLKNFVTQSQQLTVLVKGPLLKLFSATK